MAATIEIPVSRPRRLPRRRFPARVAAGAALVLVALVLAVTAALILVAVSRYPATAGGGHRTGQPVLVPRPAPGPYGS